MILERSPHRWHRWLCGPLLLGAAVLAGCSTASVPATDPAAMTAPPELVAPGDVPSHPPSRDVGPQCAEALAPLRDVVATSAYAADMTLENARVFLEASAAAQLACEPAELDAVNVSELGPWQAAVPPTFARDEPLAASEECAASLAELRAALADGDTDPTGLYSLVEASTPACEPAVTLLVRLREVEPHLRRSGVLPLATRPTTGADPAPEATNQENAP
jgi:hypothetical protein